MGDRNVFKGLADGRFSACILDADPSSFTEDIRNLSGVRFQLALKVLLRKDIPNRTEECTDPVLLHKREAALQAHAFDETMNRAFPVIMET